MRVLATLAFSFAAGIGCAVLLPWDGWQFWAACALAVVSVCFAFFARKWRVYKRGLLILCAFSASLLYFCAYTRLVCADTVSLCPQTDAFSGTAVAYGSATEYGAKITLRLRPGVRAVLYGDESLLEAQPGQHISGTARWQDAGRIHETDVTTFTSRGVYVLLYQEGDLTVEQGEAGSILYAPQRIAKAVGELIRRIWRDESTAGFVLAELTGDKSGMADESLAVVSEVGLSHLFAVSGLHCAFLVSLVCLLFSRHRRLACAVSAVLLAIYALVVGLSASVVRACIMQLFLLIGPLLRRRSDGITSLSAALAVLLLCNPYAIGGVGLQLSFAATLGLVLFAPWLYERCRRIYRGKRRTVKYAVSFLAAQLCATLAAMVFTVPLTAYHFNVFILIAPLSNLLLVSAAAWNFIAAFLTVVLGCIWLPAAQIAGYVSYALVHYILAVAKLLGHIPYHALYFSNRYLKLWLPYVYLMAGGCALLRAKRRAVICAAALSVAALVLTVWINGAEYRAGSMTVTAVDVGQGECVVLTSGGETMVVDCGSSNSYIRAGEEAAAYLNGVGVSRISCLVLTHFHADHANGVSSLMSRMPVDALWIPDMEDEFGVRDRLTDLAEQNGTQVCAVRAVSRFTLGDAAVTVYPPVGAGDVNEQGLTILCSAGDFDTLITGDMSAATERQLIRKYELPDVEVLLVSHHGSKNSSAQEFLEAIRPDAALICVGNNAYGHPTEEAMMRLSASGAAIYRTDRHGNITVTAGRGTDDGKE